jgi:hypothetical protein
MGCWGGLGGICLGLATWQLRPAYIRELQGGGPRSTRWYQAGWPVVDDRPVFWRERNVEGLAPTPWLRRIPRWLGIVVIALATTISSTTILLVSLPARVGLGTLLDSLLQLRLARFVTLLPDASTGFLLQSLLVMLLASLVVGIRCSGAVSGERERGTWEALLLTPLSAKELIRGKLWGIMGASYWYLLAYAAPAIVLSVFGGLFALLWTILWLMVTVLAMYFIGAAGLWASTNSSNSWIALVKTVGLGYVGGACIYVVASPGILFLFFLLAFVLFLIDKVAQTHLVNLAFKSFDLFFVASCIGLGLLFWGSAYLLLNRAQRWVADRERTRHWYDEPIYRKPRRLRRPAKVVR